MRKRKPAPKWFVMTLWSGLAASAALALAIAAAV